MTNHPNEYRLIAERTHKTSYTLSLSQSYTQEGRVQSAWIFEVNEASIRASACVTPNFITRHLQAYWAWIDSTHSLFSGSSSLWGFGECVYVRRDSTDSRVTFLSAVVDPWKFCQEHTQRPEADKDSVVPNCSVVVFLQIWGWQNSGKMIPERCTIHDLWTLDCGSSRWIYSMDCTWQMMGSNEDLRWVSLSLRLFLSYFYTGSWIDRKASVNNHHSGVLHSWTVNWVDQRMVARRQKKTNFHWRHDCSARTPCPHAKSPSGRPSWSFRVSFIVDITFGLLALLFRTLVLVACILVLKSVSTSSTFLNIQRDTIKIQLWPALWKWYRFGKENQLSNCCKLFSGLHDS